mgnify:CR=1 FL=1
MQRFKTNEEINFEEVVDLYKMVGWHEYVKDLDNLRFSFNNSQVKLAVYQDHQCVGFLRGLTDYTSVFLIQDLIVHPDYQNRGIGSQLLEKMDAMYPRIRQKQLLCDAVIELKKFYEKNGYVEVGSYHMCSYLKIK